MRKNFFSLMLAGTLAVLLAPSTQAAAPQTVGRIVVAKVKGTVTGLNKTDNSSRTLHDSDAISQGFVVSTAEKSSAVLLFDNGSALNLGPNTTLSIDEFLIDPFDPKNAVADAKEEPSTSVTTLSLARGEVVGSVKHLHRDNGSSYTVNTPVGAAGIRGTNYAAILGTGDNGGYSHAPDAPAPGTGSNPGGANQPAGSPPPGAGAVGGGVNQTPGPQILDASVVIEVADGRVAFTTTGGTPVEIGSGLFLRVYFKMSVSPDGRRTVVPGSMQIEGIAPMTAAQQAAIAAMIQQIVESQPNLVTPGSAPESVPPAVQTTPGDGHN